MLRYLVQIKFNSRELYCSTWDIYEPVKTLIEAQSYKSMIDDTVQRARVVDTVTDKVVEIWKGY